MEELHRNKLKSVKELQDFTTKIKELSLTTQFDNVNNMLDERQKMIENINLINTKINDKTKLHNENFPPSKQVKSLNLEIKKVFSEIVELDNFIRKNINNNLADIKEKLQLKEVRKVNIKI